MMEKGIDTFWGDKVQMGKFSSDGKVYLRIDSFRPEHDSAVMNQAELVELIEIMKGYVND